MDILPQLVLVLLFIGLNGFFVASEFALVSIRKTRLEELIKKGTRSAKLVKKAIDNLDTFISATQLGITLASIGLGWVGEPALAHFIEDYLSFLPSGILATIAHAVAAMIALIVITFLHVVLGELVPKTLALQKTETVSLMFVPALTAFVALFEPFIYVLNQAGQLIIRLLGLKPASERQTIHTEEEIKLILDQSSRSGIIPKEEVKMLHNVFKLGEMPVKQVMVPRTDIIAFNVAIPVADITKKIEKNLHSRYPIYEQSIDNIIGFIHVKDIYRTDIDLHKKVSQTTLLREIIHVPEAKKADEVLVDMRKKRTHLAVVNDEYGGTAGIVTLEDIIESLVGEIHDEFEHPEKTMKKQSDGSFLMDGRLPIEEVQHKFNLGISGQGYTTIGGLVFGLLGHEPKKGDTVQLGNVIFEVEEMFKKRIKTIKLKRERKRISSYLPALRKK